MMAAVPRALPKGPRRLVLELAAMAAVLATTLAGFEAALAGVPNSYSLKRDLLGRAAPEVEVLVLGASNAYFGLDPREWGPFGFNLANVSQTLAYDHALLDAFLDRLPKLKVVLLPAAVYQFHAELETGPESWRTFFYERAYGIPSPLDLWHPGRFSYAALYGNQEAPKLLWRYYAKGETNPALDPHGAVLTPPIQAPLTERNGKARAGLHSKIARPEAIGANRAHLEAMLDRLEARGIQAAFVTTPVWRTYDDHADPWIKRQTFGLVAGIARERGVPWLDYYRDGHFDRSDFWDSDHLNQAGARKLSRLVAADFDRTGCGPFRLSKPR